jgi:hypothetical protein
VIANWRSAAFLLGAFLVGLALMPAVVPAAGQLFDDVFPVMHSWHPSSIERDGEDLIVRGSMVKARACAYLPPPIARFESGLNVRITSTASTAALSWGDTDAPQKFGPWRVPGGAGQRMTIYVHHSCSSLWHSTTELGVINDTARAMQ